MANEQIIPSREDVVEALEGLQGGSWGKTGGRSFFDVLMECDAALRAQVAAMAEWVAKVEHSFDCESRVRQSECSGNGKCNCHLSTLPADLIARGRELLDAVEELKLWRQHLNPGEELNAALKRLKGENR